MRPSSLGADAEAEPLDVHIMLLLLSRVHQRVVTMRGRSETASRSDASS
jgi:hypothetical protein